MLYLLLFKFTLFLMLCVWLTRRNNLAVKLWSDEQLIKSLPRYQHMKNQSSQRFDVSRFVDIEARINLIKSETAARFSYDRVKTATLNYEHRQALIKSLEDKSKRASYEGNLFAKSLLEKEIEEIVSH